MKQRLKERTGRRLLSVLMAVAMVITSVSLPQVSPEVYAESSISAPNKAAFLTNEELRTLAENSGGAPYYTRVAEDEKDNIFQKANFVGKTWYVIGSEKVGEDDTLVMLSDSSLGNSAFGNSSVYSSSNIYNGLNGNGVADKGLGYNVNTLFGDNAKAYVKPVTVNGVTNSYLYIPDGNNSDSDKYSFKVGSNNQYRIPISTWSSNNSGHNVGHWFWLRSASLGNGVFSVYPAGGYVGAYSVRIVSGSVVPAFNLNLSSVLFASAAPAATSTVEMDSKDVMTFRFDSAKEADGTAYTVTEGENKVESDRISATAKANKSGVTISGAGENEFLYVQWNDNGTDKVYSCVAGDGKVLATTIGNDENFRLTEDCKVWIEKKVDNIVYAKNVEFLTHEHNWEYTLTGAVLTATCQNEDCTVEGNTVSLTPSAVDKTYDGKEAVVNVGTEAEQTAWTDVGLKSPGVSYEYKASVKGSYGTVNEAKNAGFYKANISVDGKTASVEFEIKKQSWENAPTAKTEDYDFGSYSTPYIESFDLASDSVDYYYNTNNSNTGGTEWTTEAAKSLKHGTYYLYAEIKETDNQAKCTTETSSFKVKHVHDYSLAKTVDEKAVVATCNNNEDYCGDVKTITLKTDNAVYTGQPYVPSGVDTFKKESGKNVTVSYKKYTDGGNTEDLNSAPTEVGKYQAVLKVDDPKGGDAVTVTSAFEITPKPVTAPTAGTNTYTYNGEEQTYSLNDSEDKAYYEIKNNSNKRTEAGSHTVVVGLTDTTNTCWTDDKTVNNKEFTFVIEPKKVDIPSLKCNEYTYNGQNQTFSFNKFEDSFYNCTGSSSSLTQKNAGEYSVTLSLNSKSNYKWSDEKTEDKTFIFKINKKRVEKPTEGTKTYTYNGKEQTYSLNNLADKKYYKIMNNSDKRTDAGSQDVVVGLTDKENTCWDGEGESTENLAFSKAFTINPLSIPIPTVDPRYFVCNGSEQTYRVFYIVKGNDNVKYYRDYSNVFYNISGNNQTESRNYSVTVTPKANYKWYDNSESTKTYSFKINEKEMNAKIYCLKDRNTNKLTDGYVYGKYVGDIYNPKNELVSTHYTPYLYNYPEGATYTFYACTDKNKSNSIEWDKLTYCSFDLTGGDYRTCYVYAKVTCCKCQYHFVQKVEYIFVQLSILCFRFLSFKKGSFVFQTI